MLFWQGLRYIQYLRLTEYLKEHEEAIRTNDPMTLESRMRIDGYNELISRALKIVEQQVM